MAQYLECKISNKFFDLESFECLNTIIHQKQQNFLSERVRILDSISDTINQGTQVNDDSTDDSESSAVQIVEIVIGVVAAIVFLVIVVICIRKYRQKKFKQFQLKQQQQIEANKIQTAQKVVQTQQYLQLPGGPNNPELSGVSDQRQFQSVGSGIPLQNINNGQLQQNPPFPQQINKNQIQSNPQFIQPIPVHQQLSAPPALNHIVNPALANPHIQNPPYQIQLIPGMNGVQDPYIAEQQKQLLLKEMQLKQMELQMREQNLIQIHQQQQQQLQLQPQYGDYGIQNRFASNNAISNQDQFNKPSNDYKKLSAQIEEKQQVKPQMNKNLNLNQQNSKNQQQNSDQNETPTNNPENLQFNQMKYDADNPPLPAPPANNNDNDKKVFENGGQFNYSIPKKGYFFGNQNVPQNENQIPNGFNNLNSTEVQKNIFEQQMMAIMASGAIPAGVEKKPFIQPPIAEDGEQHPNGAIDHSAFKQYNFQNQSQSLQQSKPNNQKLSDTQVQKQNFQDEILRQLQGTEVFQKNKQNQIALEPIQEQQFPKFIHDQEEEEDANLHKFDDDQDDEDDDYNNYNPNQNKNLVSQVDQINKIAVMSMNLNHNNNANINNNNNQKIENGQPFNYNGSQGIQKSLQNNFIDYMKDQLGESLGNNKLIPKFIESHVEQSLQQIKQDNIQNQEKKEIIDFNQIKLEQSQNQNQKENIQNEQKVQKANYNQILQNQTDNGQKNNSNKQKPSQLQDENSKLTCVICLDNRPEVVFQCGHTMCEPCSITIQKKSNICPLCNIPIQTTIKLFFA